MIYNYIVTTVKEFINHHFLEWERASGERRTYLQFSAYLGVPYTTLSSWKNSNVPPRGENLRRVAKKLGTEIYQIVGEPIPDDLMVEGADTITEKIEQLPEGVRPQVRQSINDTLTAILREELSLDRGLHTLT